MKAHERYIIDEREVELLDKYEGIMAQKNDPCRYDSFPKESLAVFCRMKDRSNDLYCRRFEAGKKVIDTIAEAVGIDPENAGWFLYALDNDEKSPIVERINEWVSRGGEKAKLKRRVEELTKENEFLRSLITKK